MRKQSKDRIYIVPVFENSSFFSPDSSINNSSIDSTVNINSDVSKDIVIECNSSFDRSNATHLEVPLNTSQGDSNRTRSLQNITNSLQYLTNSSRTSTSKKDEKFFAERSK